MSRSQRDNIFFQAELATPAWNLYVQVINNFKEGCLKNQKLADYNKQASIYSVNKCEFQVEHLQLIIDGEISLAELKQAAIRYRSLESIKKAFRNCTNASYWNGAVQHFSYVRH